MLSIHKSTNCKTYSILYNVVNMKRMIIFIKIFQKIVPRVVNLIQFYVKLYLVYIYTYYVYTLRMNVYIIRF